MKNLSCRLFLFPRFTLPVILVAIPWILASTATQAKSPATTVPDQSVAFQNNLVHDGYDPSSPLAPPLTLKWRKTYSFLEAQFISYPLVAQGLIIITYS